MHIKDIKSQRRAFEFVGWHISGCYRQFYSTPPNILLVGFRWDGNQGPEMGGMDPALNLAKFRKAQQELEETEDRARLAESALQH